MIGLCTKAGKTVFGGETAIGAVRSGKAKLVFLSETASGRTKKTVTDKCKSFAVPVIEKYSSGELMKITGRRSEIAVIAVCDEGFCASMLKIYEGEKTCAI
jgi:ribosomal protein L7Ae-like RNA K-turn-binding protein